MISSEERKSIGISAVASIIGMSAIVLPVGWFLVKPALTASISAAMAEDIEDKIDKKIAPLNAGFKAIIQQNVENLRRDIARMEFRRTNNAATWTVEDASDLEQKRIDLANQREALAAIVAAE